MSTRSFIGYVTPEGTVRAIFCHWDGYPSHNGRILDEHYRDPKKVFELIELGDISILRPEIGEKHPFEEPNDARKPEYRAYMAKYGRMVRAYHRDRGEPWEEVKPKTYASVEALLTELQGDRSYVEWLYLCFPDGRWYLWDTVPHDEAVQGVALEEYLATVRK